MFQCGKLPTSYLKEDVMPTGCIVFPLKRYLKYRVGSSFTYYVNKFLI